MSNTSRRAISGIHTWAALPWLCLGFAGALLLLASCGKGGQGAKSSGKKFNSPEAAAESLIAAAERFDVPALQEILGPGGEDLVVTQDTVQDRNQSQDFAAQARQQTRIIREPADSKAAILAVGTDEWPLPFPIVEQGGTWQFDSEAGRAEVLHRRIGENELDAIEVCRGFVEAQQEYAAVKHDGAIVNQYAQHIISTPGKNDGLAWKAADGTWQGPVGEAIARVIAEGYTSKYEPYHGYFFKVLKAQGPAAPLGAMDFVVQGAMIGGFALAAAPAEYEVTGVKSFIVSHDGVVYEKDMGAQTMEQFQAIERFDPDSTWSAVTDS
jgi:hypothetical protein